MVTCYCKECYNQVYNPNVLYLVDLVEDKKLFKGLMHRYDFTKEDKKEVIDILKNNIKQENVTRGNIKKGIE